VTRRRTGDRPGASVAVATLPAMACARPFALRRPAAGLAVAVLLLIAGALAGPAALAHAGTWTLVSCTQPDGAPAPTDGWSPGVWAGNPIPGGGVVNGCAAAGSLTAVSSAAAPVASFTGPEWVFTAPAGATIAGGSITGSFTAPEGQAWIATPSPAFDAADEIAGCPAGGPCGVAGVLAGTFPITHLGGTRIYAPALCSQPSAAACPVGAVNNAEVDIHAADIELAVTTTPRATDYGGSLLEPRATGDAELRFTATDPQHGGGSGPGVYSITVEIDGRTVYTGVPDTDHGTCAPLGVDPATGGLEFDDSQPCATNARISVPIDTTTLGDGPHALTVTVSDAAGDHSTVLSRTITTFNPELTPLPRDGEGMTQLLAGWSWSGPRTTLRTVAARGLPPTGGVAVRCLGHHCPPLPPGAVTVAAVGRLWAALKTAAFAPGQRLQITVIRPNRRHHRHHRSLQRPPESITFRFRRDAPPSVSVG
jgi:hypothetical protein